MNVPAYAIAYIRDLDFGPEIIEYIEKIDATLAPYGGRFIVHGGPIIPAEGEFEGDFVIIRFPDADAPPRSGTPRRPTRRSCRCAPSTRARRRPCSAVCRRTTERSQSSRS